MRRHFLWIPNISQNRKCSQKRRVARETWWRVSSSSVHQLVLLVLSYGSRSGIRVSRVMNSKEGANFHCARPVSSTIKRIQTSRLAIQNCLSLWVRKRAERETWRRVSSSSCISSSFSSFTLCSASCSSCSHQDQSHTFSFSLRDNAPPAGSRGRGTVSDQASAAPVVLPAATTKIGTH